MKSIYDKIVYIYGKLVDMIKASTPAGYPDLVEKVDAIDACIPDLADADNQLADKEFVNSSIATSTATFRGTYVLTGLGLDGDPFSATHDDVAAAVQATLDRLGTSYDGSDYVFVQVPQNPQPEGADPRNPAMSRVDRYKCVETGTDPVVKNWEYEWTLNNSSFTAAQWAAVVSGITSGLVAKLGALPTADELARALAGKLGKSEPVSWAELRALRDGGNLVPGQQYRITDYVATTNGDMESRSANHPFDVIVTADDERTLNEHARAIMHENVLDFSSGTQYAVGDFCKYEGTVYKCTTAHVGEWNAGDFTEESPYFYNCDLAAWDVWYCLDNDASRFAWTDSVNGKGVIYRLVDEFQNDVPYDFKGLQFIPYNGNVVIVNTASALSATGEVGKVYYVKDTRSTVRWNPDWDLDGDGVVDEGEQKYLPTDEAAFRYTFDSGDASGNTDLSLAGTRESIYSNEINPYFAGGNQKLNRIVFKGSYCNSNTFGSNCYYNTFGSNCNSNTFGSNCYYNTFGSNCNSNTFGSSCYSNTFGSSCYYNTFGSNCYYNTFGSNCNSNTFGSRCYSNTFGSNCYAGNWSNYTQSYVGTAVKYNNALHTVLNRYRASFSTSQTYLVGETLYYDSQYWECTTEHRGKWNAAHFTEIQLVGGILSAEEHVPLSAYRYVELEDGVSYVALDCTADRGNGVYYQNVTVSKGIAGTESAPRHIEDANYNQDYKTTYQPADSQTVAI